MVWTADALGDPFQMAPAGPVAAGPLFGVESAANRPSFSEPRHPNSLRSGHSLTCGKLLFQSHCQRGVFSRAGGLLTIRC